MACAAVCKVHAISMKEDERGFFSPHVDDSICVGCGQCVKTCPGNAGHKKDDADPDVHVAWSKDKNIRKKSSSGGIFGLLAREIISRGGIVYGVRYTDKFSTEHVPVTCIEDLPAIMQSKYVQSDMNGCYSDVKKHLTDGKQVLFSGTPCQVHALKLFLGKEYDNLYTVDLICHGVPPYKVFLRYLNEISGNNISLISGINLRHKKPGWTHFSVRIDYKNGISCIRPSGFDSYFSLFVFNYILRPSCYSCLYTSVNRVGDITLGDFWGYLPNNFKMRGFNGGCSCAMINNEKGQKLFNLVVNKIISEKKSINNALRANQSLSKPFSPPPDKEDLWKDFLSGVSINALYFKYITKPYKIPKLYKLRMLYRTYKWMLKRLIKR